ALCGRIDLVAAADGWRTTLEVTARDGSVVFATADEPLGHARHPASPEHLQSKWRRLSGADGSAFYDRLVAAGPAVGFAALVTTGAPWVAAGSAGGSRP